MIGSLAKDGMKIAVGITMMVAFLFLLWASVFLDLENTEVVNLLIGNVMGVVSTIAAYYYGSSKGSDVKTQIMAKQASDALDV